jgi:hypothetical protein
VVGVPPDPEMPMACTYANIKAPITYVSSKATNKKDIVADMASSWTTHIAS